MDLTNQRKRCFGEWMEANGLNVNRIAEDTHTPRQTLYSWLRDGKRPLGQAAEEAIARHYDFPVDAIFGPAYEAEAGMREPNFVGKWRERAKLTRKELAARLHTSETAIELLEEGQMTLSAKWLTRLAEVFATRPGFVMHDPDQLDAEMLDAFGVPKDQQSHALQILDTFRARAAG